MASVNGERLLRTIDELGEIGKTEQGGVTRLCFSPAEIEAKKYIINLMTKAGLEVHVDPVANVTGILEGSQDEPPVACGSHIDTVINGGRYDGAYGVLAAIEALRTIRESQVKWRHPLVAVSFTNEEGVRFPTMLGSKYASAMMTLPEVLATRGIDGVTFAEALKNSGLELDQTSFLLTHKPQSYLELHIEQGPILENRSIQIGVVDHIVGTREIEIVIYGSANHAGTTPMNARKDALLAASRLIQYVNTLALEMGGGCVGTVGFIQVFPNASNVISSEVKLMVDFRSGSSENIDTASDRLNDAAQRIAQTEGVRAHYQIHADLAPAKMSEPIVQQIECTSKDLGYSCSRMQSGAGHDAMIISRIAQTGMIFVPSKGGKSHSPLEHTDPNDIIRGANVLATTLQRIAG